MVSNCQENELRYFDTCIFQTTAVDVLVALTIGAFFTQMILFPEFVSVKFPVKLL